MKYSECERTVNPLKFVKLKLPATEVFIYEGERKYLVHEDFCTCMDFLLKKLKEGKPCKHICTIKLNSSSVKREVRLDERELKAKIVRVLLRAQ